MISFLKYLFPRGTLRRVLLLAVRDLILSPASMPRRFSKLNFHNYFVARRLTISCNVCGNRSGLHYDFPDTKLRKEHGIGILRETLNCLNCGASMRDRQLAKGLLDVQNNGHKNVESIQGLRDFNALNFSILDTDSFSAINDRLKGLPGYRCSQFKPNVPNGEQLDDGSVNADLTQLPFPEHSFDVILTSDVMEHVSEDDAAHNEIFRCLKLGGHYIFTVPYDQNLLVNKRLTEHCGIKSHKFILQRHIHGDPQAAGGIEAHRIYGRQIIEDLTAIGFSVQFKEIFDSNAGIFGGDLFVAAKPTGINSR